jgi:hypothetical protein
MCHITLSRKALPVITYLTFKTIVRGTSIDFVVCGNLVNCSRRRSALAVEVPRERSFPSVREP